MKLKQNPHVEVKFDEYPEDVFPKIRFLRDLIIETAKDNPDVQYMEETLKWGEPSYIARRGTTIRINWTPKKPDQYGMYFQCTSLMIPTIKEVHKDTFQYEGSRALIFDLNQDVPVEALKDCINMGLRYHDVKHLPRLGMAEN